MKSADSGKLAEAAQALVRWILDQALDGIGPLPSSSELAEQYRHQPYANDAGRVQALIRWAVAKNAGTGFVTGPWGRTDVAGGDSRLVSGVPRDSGANGGSHRRDLRARLQGRSGPDCDPALHDRDGNGGRGEASWSDARREDRDRGAEMVRSARLPHIQTTAAFGRPIHSNRCVSVSSCIPATMTLAKSARSSRWSRITAVMMSRSRSWY